MLKLQLLYEGELNCKYVNYYAVKALNQIKQLGFNYKPSETYGNIKKDFIVGANTLNDVIVMYELDKNALKNNNVRNILNKLRNQMTKIGYYLWVGFSGKNKFDKDRFISGNEEVPFIYVGIKQWNFRRVKAPKFLYHRTKSENIKSIQENGLIPNENAPYGTTKSIFVTTDPKIIDPDKGPVILQIDTSKIPNHKWWSNINPCAWNSNNQNLITSETIPSQAITINSDNSHEQKSSQPPSYTPPIGRPHNISNWRSKTKKFDFINNS